MVCLFNGGPVAFVDINNKAEAILECWYLGQEGGTALADVLFGDYNPSGKLPISLPKSVGQIPVYYNYKPTARRGYIFDEIGPLYPFGYGLSYTTFSYDTASLALSADSASVNDKMSISINIKNTGNRKGREVVQLYIRDKVSSVTRPIKELKAFTIVDLEPGQEHKVTFAITPDMLAFFNENMERVVETGAFELQVGSSSQDVISKSIYITEGTTEL